MRRWFENAFNRGLASLSADWMIRMVSPGLTPPRYPSSSDEPVENGLFIRQKIKGTIEDSLYRWTHHGVKIKKASRLTGTPSVGSLKLNCLSSKEQGQTDRPGIDPDEGFSRTICGCTTTLNLGGGGVVRQDVFRVERDL